MLQIDASRARGSRRAIATAAMGRNRAKIVSSRNPLGNRGWFLLFPIEVDLVPILSAVCNDFLQGHDRNMTNPLNNKAGTAHAEAPAKPIGRRILGGTLRCLIKFIISPA